MTQGFGKQVAVLSPVKAELHLRQIPGKMLGRNLVPASDDAALKSPPLGMFACSEADFIFRNSRPFAVERVDFRPTVFSRLPAVGSKPPHNGLESLRRLAVRETLSAARGAFHDSQGSVRCLRPRHVGVNRPEQDVHYFGVMGKLFFRPTLSGFVIAVGSECHFILLPANHAGFRLTQEQHSKWKNTCQVNNYDLLLAFSTGSE